jgi:nitrogen-specific signal transduction histidine kinase/HAMP domain-containing protein
MKHPDSTPLTEVPITVIGAPIERESIAKTRRQTVRLTVSIPAVTALIVVGGGIFLRDQLLTIALDPATSPRIKDGIEYSADLVLIFTAVVATISALVGLLLAFQIVKPLRAIEESLAALTRGELTQIPSSPLSEFSNLGSTFNSMVTHLERLFAERDRQMQEASARARLLLDKGGHVRFAEGALKRILNVSPRELVGGDFSASLAEHENPGVQALMRGCAKLLNSAPSMSVTECDITFDRSGEEVVLNLVISPLVAEGEGPEEWLLEIRDMTAAKSFREQMQRADRLAAVGTLATGIAHEIRNPLASMKGMMQLLQEQTEREGPPMVPPEEYHRRVIGEIVRLERLVSAIMDFAQGEPQLPEETDLNGLLRATAEAAILSVGEGADIVELRFELEDGLPFPILQQGRLRQALLNLIKNAVEAVLERGSGGVRISSMYLPVNEVRPLILCISNPCDLLSQDEIERIFEPFHTTKAEGTGLGLPIAYQAIVSNGGVLECDMEAGDLRFWIRLPLDSRTDLRRTSGVVLKANK